LRIYSLAKSDLGYVAYGDQTRWIVGQCGVVARVQEGGFGVQHGQVSSCQSDRLCRSCQQRRQVNPKTIRPEYKSAVEIDLGTGRGNERGVFSELAVEPGADFGDYAAGATFLEDFDGTVPIGVVDEEVDITEASPGRIGIVAMGRCRPLQDAVTNTGAAERLRDLCRLTLDGQINLGPAPREITD
jgi:hypothetical protein